MGGRDDTTELNSVEKYNPLTDTWSTVVAMISRRSGVRVYAVKLFSIITYLTEILDEQNN